MLWEVAEEAKPATCHRGVRTTCHQLHQSVTWHAHLKSRGVVGEWRPLPDAEERCGAQGVGPAPNP